LVGKYILQHCKCRLVLDVLDVWRDGMGGRMRRSGEWPKGCGGQTGRGGEGKTRPTGGGGGPDGMGGVPDRDLWGPDRMEGV
jgi:hypothetical protein